MWLHFRVMPHSYIPCHLKDPGLLSELSHAKHRQSLVAKEWICRQQLSRKFPDLSSNKLQRKEEGLMCLNICTWPERERCLSLFKTSLCSGSSAMNHLLEFSAYTGPGSTSLGFPAWRKGETLTFEPILLETVYWREKTSLWKSKM